METLSALLDGGNPMSPGDSIHKGLVTRIFDVSFDVSHEQTAE